MPDSDPAEAQSAMKERFIFREDAAFSPDVWKVSDFPKRS
jgi:hypothetical protein